MSPTVRVKSKRVVQKSVVDTRPSVVPILLSQSPVARVSYEVLGVIYPRSFSRASFNSSNSRTMPEPCHSCNLGIVSGVATPPLRASLLLLATMVLASPHLTFVFFAAACTLHGVLQAAQEALKQLTTERPEGEALPEIQVIR